MEYSANHTAERCALSCIMRGGGQVRSQAEKMLRPAMFDRYETLASTVLRIAASGGRPDPDTVRAEVDEEERLDEVLEHRPVPKNVEQFIEGVIEAWGSRRLQDKALSAATDSTDAPFMEVATQLEEDVIEITTDVGSGQPEAVGDLVQDVFETLEEEQGQRITGVPSGFDDLDRMTRGWQSSDLVIPFGSTSMGKTSFALSCALNAAKRGHGVAIHSLEMPAQQITRRLVTMEARVDLRQTAIPDEGWQRVTRAMGHLETLPIYIDEASGLDPLSHRARLRHLDHAHGIDFAVVDYLQQMRAAEAKDRRHDEIHSVAEGLKATAKILDLPVMVPSQTTRGPDSDGSRPTLSDLREAGEEPADVGLGLYRPEYYGITTDEMGRDTEGVGEVIVAKQRNGPTGSARLAFVKQYAAWEQLEDREPSPTPSTGDSAPF